MGSAHIANTIHNFAGIRHTIVSVEMFSVDSISLIFHMHPNSVSNTLYQLLKLMDLGRSSISSFVYCEYFVSVQAFEP